MRNVVMLLGLVFTLNLNAQMKTTEFSTIYLEQLGDGVRFQLDITVMEGKDGDELRFFQISDGIDYVYSYTMEANYALHQKQLVELAKWNMNQFIFQIEGDGDENFIWWQRGLDYVATNFEAKNEGGVDIIKITAITVSTGEKQDFLYKIIGFKDNLKSEENKLSGGSKI